MPQTQTSSTDLPPIPQKRYFTIGEVSTLCGVKSHVLRYWEQEFPNLKPTKRRGNRRYYQQADVILIRHIRELLYDRGYTISGARQKLQDEHKSGDGKPLLNTAVLNQALADLQAALKLLDAK